MNRSINQGAGDESATGTASIEDPGSASLRSTGAPMATLTGPIPVNAEFGEPFKGVSDQPLPGPGLPSPDLSVFDYVEEEYFLSGMTGGKPYKTCVIIRKPRDAAKFSGLVAVETIHSLGAFPLWGARVWMSQGHGYVAVASQLPSLEHFVRTSNPVRYADLAIPLAPDSPDGAMPVGQSALSGGPQDRISQEIIAQLGRLLKANLADGPFAGMSVRQLLLGGWSQTGGTTLRYIQQSHQIERLSDGGPIFDAYLAFGYFSATPLPSVDAAVIHGVAEGDLMNRLNGALGESATAIGYRNDSDGTDRHRHYQYAGMSHVDTRGQTDIADVIPLLAAEGGLRPGEILSQYPVIEFVSSCANLLVDWVLNDKSPPRAPRIEVVDGVVVRDEIGNARGGVRSPWVDVPTVRYINAQPIAEGDSIFRPLIGLEVPIPDTKLHEMYGSREEYLERFKAELDRLAAERWLIADYATRLRTEEAEKQLF